MKSSEILLMRTNIYSIFLSRGFLIPLFILLMQVQTFSQENKFHHFNRHQFLKDSQNLNKNQLKHSISLKKEQPNFLSSQQIHVRKPVKVLDEYQNSGRLAETWDSTGWHNYQRDLYSYDIDGNRIEEKTQNWNGSGWIDTMLHKTEYPENNYISSYQFWDGFNWINIYRYSYLYDSSWHFIGNLWEIGDSLNWVNKQKGICYWNDNTDKQDSIITLNWENNKWKNFEKQINYYSYKEADSLQRIFYWNDSIWIQRYQRVYTLDNASPSFNYVYQQWEGSVWVNQYRYSSFYTPQYTYLGNMDERWNDSAQTWEYNYKYSYYYNASNQDTEYLYQTSPDGINWESEWHYTYEYDTSGRDIKDVLQYWEAGWKNYSQYLYEFDANGNRSVEKYQMWNGNSWVNDTRYTYTWQFIVGVNEPVVVNKFKLYNSYPNPFNPTTRIRYSIGTKEFVTMKVYDLLGREVAALVNEEKPAGTYEIIFDTQHTKNYRPMASGVYFYRIQAGSFTDTKKFIFLK